MQRLLPEVNFSESTLQIAEFNPKSIKTMENVGKLYNFKNGHIP
jgi:hypothetical protein